MKKICFILIASTFASAHSAQANLALAQSKSCIGCHSVEAKILGPSFKEIASTYEHQSDAVDTLVTSITSGSINKWGSMPMAANHISNEDAHTLAKWILSLH